MEALVGKRSDYALLKVDIKSWKSPVALQFGIQSIPYLRVYDRGGNLVAEGKSAYQYIQSH